MERERREARATTGGAAAPRRASRPGPVSAVPAAGNAALARVLDGDGLLPGGVVHPAVEQAISGRAGRGSRLDARMSAWASSALALDSSRVSVHHDAAADALSRSVAARAFTVRNDVFFAAGEYRPATDSGRRLIAHELAHVGQQAGAAAGGPLRVTNPGDVHERHADQVARELDG